MKKIKLLLSFFSLLAVINLTGCGDLADALSESAPVVTGVKAVASEYDSVTLSWDRVEGAEGYKIYIVML